MTHDGHKKGDDKEQPDTFNKIMTVCYKERKDSLSRDKAGISSTEVPEAPLRPRGPWGVVLLDGQPVFTKTRRSFLWSVAVWKHVEGTDQNKSHRNAPLTGCALIQQIQNQFTGDQYRMHLIELWINTVRRREEASEHVRVKMFRKRFISRPHRLRFLLML